MTTSVNRLPLESLSCVNADCEQCGRSGQNNLIIRKIYGKDQIRYLRCRGCGEELSERKLTGLWNCKIPEERAIRVSQQLAEGTSLKGTARLTTTHPVVKHRQGNKLAAVAVAKAHGSWRRIQPALDELRLSGAQYLHRRAVQCHCPADECSPGATLISLCSSSPDPQSPSLLEQGRVQLGAPPSQSQAKVGRPRGKTALSATNTCDGFGANSVHWE
jgi:ribosomal protein L37AE/L43A